MHTLRIVLFGERLKTLAGTKEIVLEITQSEPTLGDLKEAIAKKVPALKPMINSCYLAEDNKIAIRHERGKINPNAELVLIGATAGG